MKNIKRIILGIAALGLIFTSCEGPAGRDGLDGLNGINAEETVIYELAGLTFDNTNDFLINDAIPNDIVIDDSDIVVVYRLLSTDTNVGDIWEALPQMYFLDEGILQYNFNFSQSDLDFILDADFDLNTFDNPTYTDEQVFRIAVIPARDNTSAKLLTSNLSYSQVAKGVDVIKVNL